MRLNITARLLLGYLLIGFLPLLLYGTLAYQDFRQSLQQETLVRLQSVTKDHLSHFEDYTARLQREISVFSKNPSLVDSVSKIIEDHLAVTNDPSTLNSRALNASRNRFQSLIDQYARVFEYSSYLIISRDGDVVFSMGEEVPNGLNLPNAAARHTQLFEVFVATKDTQAANLSKFIVPGSISEMPGFYTAAPVMGEEGLIGVIAFKATGRTLQAMALDFEGLGQTGELVLAGKQADSALVVAPLRHDSGAAFKRKMVIGSNIGVPIQKAVMGESGNGVSVDYRGHEILAYWRHIPELDLGLVIKIDTDEAYAPVYAMRWQSIYLALFVLIFTAVGGWLIARGLSRPLSNLTRATERIVQGDLDQRLSIQRSDEIGQLAVCFNDMVDGLQEATKDAEEQIWLKTGLSRLSDTIRGDLDKASLGRKVIKEIASYLDAQIGAIYFTDEVDETDGGEAARNLSLSLTGSYAYKKRKHLSNQFSFGEGLVGQAALEKQQILINEVPEDYIKVTSGLGEKTPRCICVTPCLHENQVVGVIEIGTLHELSDLQLEYLSQATPSIGIAIQSANGKMQLASALKASLRMSKDLQSQQEELKSSNEELQQQKQWLEESESKLQAQQEELQVMNEELEAKNDLLEQQKLNIEAAATELEEKAESLAMASKYKSEFLANMSHELRTPLNSLLLLSQSLMLNKDENLNKEQLESINIIHSSGGDLLNLINEILDLSKIEAGHMNLSLETVPVSDIAASVKSSFTHLAKSKGIDLNLEVEDDCPAEIDTDQHRLVQVIRNLVSNAIKFTHEGAVDITLGRAPSQAAGPDSNFPGEYCFMVSVKDTGIGISEKQAKIIFEAFQQAEGGTARRYGGTGLGLAISKEIVHALGGEIKLESKLGEGSTFNVFLPIDSTQAGISRMRGSADKHRPRGQASPNPEFEEVDDDRDNLEEGDRVILVIEDDERFADLLVKQCRPGGMKCLLARSGEAGLALASEYIPDGIILDIRLPGMDGWVVLDRLKSNLKTRHIPVHVISAEDDPKRALQAGAIGHALKPLDRQNIDEALERLQSYATKKRKSILVVEDDDNTRRSTIELLKGRDVRVEEATTGKQALEKLRKGGYDCVVLDLKLPGIDGEEILAQLEKEAIALPPVVIYTAGELTREDELKFREHAGAIVVKDVRSQERLLDEVSLFLHRVVSKMPRKKREIIRNLQDSSQVLSNKKVLVVDDDMRTNFAMARLLTEHGASALKAENGKKALELLRDNPDMSLVLMDIMMPVMDGYETIRKIRDQDQFRNLPIIALTAKAMPEDRNKCIEAGANDYLPKPVDMDQLLAILGVWLRR